MKKDDMKKDEMQK